MAIVCPGICSAKARPSRASMLWTAGHRSTADSRVLEENCFESDDQTCAGTVKFPTIEKSNGGASEATFAENMPPGIDKNNPFKPMTETLRSPASPIE